MEVAACFHMRWPHARDWVRIRTRRRGIGLIPVDPRKLARCDVAHVILQGSRLHSELLVPDMHVSFSLEESNRLESNTAYNTA